MSDTSLASLRAEAVGEPDGVREHRNSGSLLVLGLLFVLMVVHVGMNLWWLHTDNHTIRTDEEGHMLLARTYYDTLFVKKFGDPVKRLVAVSEIRPGNPAHPPLLHLLGALMIGLFGYSTDTIALTNTVSFVLLLCGCFMLMRRFLDPWQSLFVVFVVSFTPMVFSASRFFMTDYAAAAIVVWAMVALVRSDGFHRPGWVFLFGVLNGLGILVRTITFAYLLVPAILTVGIGLFRLLRRKDAPDPSAYSWGLWLVNIVMTLTVALGIFAPWYYKNLDPFYDYWSNKRIGDTRGALTNFAAPAPAPAPVSPTPAVVPPVSPGDVLPAPVIEAPVVVVSRPIDYVVEKVKHPAVAWIRYPVYLVNNGLFLPLALVAALGMLLAGLRGQFRSSTLLYLYAWIFGSWFFFSVMLRLGTPRYGVPVAPALAIFAALFILMLPLRWFRQTMGVILAALLLFQYSSLTTVSIKEGALFTIPASIVEKEARHFVDDGLVVFKDHLTLSDSYGSLGAPRSDNYKERFIERMLAHEKSLPVREGKYANYQKLRLRGMPLHEKHYWPGDNPYRLEALSPDQIPERRLRLIHMGLEPEHLLPLLPETDYILYQVEESQANLAKAYEAYFGERGFETIETFEVPAFGWVPKTINGVLARKLEGELVSVTAASVADMDFYDLHELRASADFNKLSPELQTLVGSTADAKLSAIASPFPMSSAVTFMAADVRKTGEDLFQFRLVFRVEATMERDWRMLFHGFVAEDDLPKLPAEKRNQGYVDWNFEPQPPTSAWVPGRYVVLTHHIKAVPLVYQFKFGFFRDNELFGQTALLKTMDLSGIP